VTLYILNGITNQISFSGLNNTNYLFTLNLSDGIYSWNYRACDTSGNCAFSPANNILVINTSSQNQTNLQIHFVSPTPTDGSVSQNSIPINITTSNSSSVVNITVYLYDSSRRLVNTFGQVNSSLFTFNMTPNSGTYYINATAFDNAGNSNSTETRMIILQLSNNNNNNGNQNSEVSTGYSYIDVYQNQPPQINRTSPEIITEQPTNSNTISLGFVILLFEIFLVLIVLGIIILVFAKRKFRD
jgi:hypothetical protein